MAHAGEVVVGEEEQDGDGGEWAVAKELSAQCEEGEQGDDCAELTEQHVGAEGIAKEDGPVMQGDVVEVAVGVVVHSGMKDSGRSIKGVEGIGRKGGGVGELRGCGMADAVGAEYGDGLVVPDLFFEWQDEHYGYGGKQAKEVDLFSEANIGCEVCAHSIAKIAGKWCDRYRLSRVLLWSC